MGSTERNTEEYQYLDLVREILEQGERRPDRYVSPNVPDVPSCPSFASTGQRLRRTNY